MSRVPEEHKCRAIEYCARLAANTRRTAKSTIGRAKSIDDTTTLATCASNSEIKHSKAFTPEAEAAVRAYDFARLPIIKAAVSIKEDNNKRERVGLEKTLGGAVAFASRYSSSRIAPQHREMVPHKGEITIH